MKVKSIYISDKSKYYSGKKKAGVNPEAKSEIKETIECHEGKGIVGDRFYDYKEDFKGQITFMSYDLYLKMQEELGIEIDLVDYRRNVFVEGGNPLDLVGKKFKVGSAEFLGVEDCAPCVFMDKNIIKGAKDWMVKNKSGGLRAKVLVSGNVSLGDKLSEL